MTHEKLREAVARALCRRNGSGLCVGFCHTERCRDAVQNYGEDADVAIAVVLDAAAGVAKREMLPLDIGGSLILDTETAECIAANIETLKGTRT